jgi:hypothetical protein
MKKHTVAIVGTGPSGLMAATILARAGVSVAVFEKRRAPAAKLLVAGKSGLNISNERSALSLAENYSGPNDHFSNIFAHFSVKDWIEFVHSLGVETFVGTSGRYFIRGMTTPQLLKPWMDHLKTLGVSFHYHSALEDFDSTDSGVRIRVQGLWQSFSACVLALGGASWLPDHEAESHWARIFEQKGIACRSFMPANAGFEVDWKPAFIQRAEGKPIKNIVLLSSHGACPGDLMVTAYGLEGTPIYNLREPEVVYLDLKPSLSLESIVAKAEKVKKMSPLRTLKKCLKLSPMVEDLLYFHAPESAQQRMDEMIALLKKFPVTLVRQRGLAEAISSRGGVCFSEVNDALELRQFKGVYLAGEMLDWDTSTGGFLIQACVSQGHWVAMRILESWH